MDPNDISAHIEIQQVLYRYCRAIDRGDVTLLKSVYHPDATDAHGAFNGPAHEFAEIIVARMNVFQVTGQHQITNIIIELDGEAARVESYFQAFHPSVLEGGGEGLAFAVGRYLDRFERRDGAWKIADRRVVFDHARAPAKFAAWETAAQYPQGGRLELDPSHAFFGARAALGGNIQS